MTSAVLVGRNGLGDAIYARPLVKLALTQFDHVWLATAWPEVFSDLPVRFVRPETTMRPALENMERWKYEEPPPETMVIQLKYPWRDIRKLGIPGAMERAFRSTSSECTG